MVSIKLQRRADLLFGGDQHQPLTELMAGDIFQFEPGLEIFRLERKGDPDGSYTVRSFWDDPDENPRTIYDYEAAELQVIPLPSHSILQPGKLREI
jgi:hypothetical protein